MTEQRPDQAIWPLSNDDVPTTAPGRAPAVPPVRPTTPATNTRTKPTVNGTSPAATAGGTPSRRRSPRPSIAVVVVVALAGATTAFGLGWWSGQPHRQNPATVSAPALSPTPGEPIAQRQAAANRARFPTPAVAAFAEPWLDKVDDCTPDTTSGGPQRGAGEQNRTRCTAGIITTYWISYRTLTDRDRAQSRYHAQAADAPTLTPGAAPPNRAAHYIEYAYTIPSGQRAGQVVAAVWWSDPTQPVAGVFLAYWSEGLGSSWAPLRDLWNKPG